MSARRGGKRSERAHTAPHPAEAGAPTSDDEIEILEVVGLNETEPPSPEHAHPAAPAPAETAPGAPTGELQEALRERDRYHDSWLRQQAEFENFRKRAERDAAQRRIADAADLVRRLLPVLDNLESALLAGGDHDDPLRRGLELIRQQMLEVLGREGLAPVASVGEPFDPQQHEAVEVVAGDAASAGTVLAEMRKGYTFKERLIRPALVRVATGGAAGEGADPAAAD